MTAKISISADKFYELYWVRKLSLAEIAAHIGCSESGLQHRVKESGFHVRDRYEAAKTAVISGRRKVGSSHSHWKGGRFQTYDGYVLVYSPEHPRAKKKVKPYVFEHILVWETVHQQSLPESYVVHHLNGIKNDNRPANLVAFPERKHRLVLEAKSKRIRALEAEVRLLQKALEDSQMIFRIGES